jgi:hypothetical protein
MPGAVVPPARWLAALALATAAAAAGAAVEVRFADAEQFSDATLQGYGDDPAANPVLAELRRHLLALGARCIPPEHSLKIVVRDLDLAGHYDWRYRESLGNFRLLPNAAWVRMTIEYEWRDPAGAVIAASVDRLHSADFLGGPARPRSGDGPLPDEKQLLDRWFEPRFCRGGRAGGSAAPTR